jgi:hypothetical protein
MINSVVPQHVVCCDWQAFILVKPFLSSQSCVFEIELLYTSKEKEKRKETILHTLAHTYTSCIRDSSFWGSM